MKLKNYFKSLSIFLFYFLFGTLQFVQGSNTISDLENPYAGDIVVPFARILTLIILLSGAFLIIMIVYGAIKLSMAFGRPNEFDGAKKTFTAAFIGFCIIVGFFAFWRIITGALGISSFSSPSAVFDAIRSAIENLLIQARVFPNGTGSTGGAGTGGGVGTGGGIPGQVR